MTLVSSSKTVKLLSAICGIAVGLPVVAVTAKIAFAQSPNPCPQLYYEEPFNSDRAVPAGCPPNAATQRLIDQGRIAPAAPAPDSSATPPLPETQLRTIATVTPVSGTVSVVLKNDTNTDITYEALESTDQRTLAAGQEVTLQGLPAPTTINLNRPDGGFIKVTTVPTQEPGRLAVALGASGNLSDNVRSLQIQADGQVLAY